ncbi:DUF1616 domain-containing protein [Natrarchaeobius oligotrophus]|uniref:DUF1616 domain-containing protein n=1 Tax=Natrarchaeobius chitinivorans TaxID=1679083 RepID=A0A3N6N3M8_NATCH|nr:DUF1616 domain-containing protein [Natrarchaeobius chitinivorans]RQH02267.1 DUF1616 domain-containing protein [Natrarchaeobius chitinivorans]
MVDRRSLWLLLPRPVRALPADLGCTLVVTLLVNVAVFAPVVRETPLRIPLGLLFVLFIPGYVFIAALFPEAGERASGDERAGSTPDEKGVWGEQVDESRENDVSDGDGTGLFSDAPSRSGIDGIERVALAFGLSIAITPLIGLALNFTPWGIRLAPIMVATTGFTLAVTAIAAIRRWDLPPEDRFRVPYREWYESGRTELLEPESRTDGLLNALLVLSIVLALGTVTFAIVVPPQGEEFSAVYILTEDDGELVADGYPTDLSAGESAEIVLGVDNHEHRTVDYTVVVLEQETDQVPNESGIVDESNESVLNETVVTNQRELDRFETRLEHNESWHHAHSVEPSLTGENVRIVWLLYPDGGVPSEPTMETTDYSVHLWVNIDESAEQN